MKTPSFSKESNQSLNDSKLLKAQLYIQNNLDGDLSLQTVSRAVGISSAHFHRLFKAHIGETLKRYVDRLRVEKSLYDIRITDLNLLQISLRYGFSNPETYSRAFKRHLGQLPSVFLKNRPEDRDTFVDAAHASLEINVGLRQVEAANFSITRLSGLHLAFMRHVGPYKQVPLVDNPGPTIWTQLAEFVKQSHLASGPAIYIGIPQDSPGITAPEKLRYDACMVVDRPFDVEGKVGYQQIPAGYFGVLTHAGSYATLSDAYQKLFYHANGLSRFGVESGAVFELLLDISATSIEDHTWTELYLPLSFLN